MVGPSGRLGGHLAASHPEVPAAWEMVSDRPIPARTNDKDMTGTAEHAGHSFI